MQSCHTIDTEAIMNVNVCHMHHIIFIDNGQFFSFILSAYLIIQHLDDRYKLRNHFFQIMHRPFFQCFCKNRMIGICACLLHDFNSIIHLDSTLCQQSDQLRNNHGRMGIIDLDHRIIWKIIQCTALCDTFIQNQLCGIADHKILLINTQFPSVFITVIRIQE